VCSRGHLWYNEHFWNVCPSVLQSSRQPFIQSTSYLKSILRTQGSAVSSVKLFGWAVLKKAASSNVGGQAIVLFWTGMERALPGVLLRTQGSVKSSVKLLGWATSLEQARFDLGHCTSNFESGMAICSGASNPVVALHHCSLHAGETPYMPKQAI